MTRTSWFTPIAVAAALFLVVPAASVRAQANAAPSDQDHQSHHPAAEPSSDAKAQPPATHEHGTEGPQGMMAERAAANAKLDALVVKMNASKGEARIDAMAELLTALVQQHTAMGRMMADPGKRMQEMMKGMHEMMMGMERMMDETGDGK